MKNKPNLSVRPVRKSKKPSYPSWQEPNPLEQPYAQPYPFTQKALNWLAASGLCGALFFAQEAEGGVVKQPDKMERMDKDTLGNPFPQERMGLPYRPSKFGTGLPQRMQTNDAKAVIDSLFRAQGFQMQRMTLSTPNGLVEVDAYDEKENIGYVWLDWQRMGEGMTTPWDESTEKILNERKALNEMRIADQEIFRHGYSIKKMLNDLSNLKHKDSSTLDFIKKLQNMVSSGLPDWQDDYRFIFYEHFIEHRLENRASFGINSSLFKQYLRNTLSTDPSEERNQGLDIAMDVLQAYWLREDWYADILAETATRCDAKQQLQFLSRIKDAYYDFEHYDMEKREEIKKLISNAKYDWAAAAEQAAQWLDAKKVSMAEANDLFRDADAKKRYIAIISQQDDRFIYQISKKDENRIRSRKREDYIKKHPNATEDEIAQAIEDRFNRYSIYKEDVLKQLEKMALDYINWAKQQRGY
ncbi:MAG: hypothetical protein IT258_24285 [Saprospiraceae bacterium]|nr:hypothetical protein [Saprospiraceae bacterium]